MPLNFWLEYLDLVFFFKYLHGHVDLTRSFNYYFSFVTSQTRQAGSGLNLKINNNRTSTFRDYYFNRIANLWNNIPNNVRQAVSIDSFKRKLKSVSMGKPGRTRQEVIQLKSPILLKLGINVGFGE